MRTHHLACFVILLLVVAAAPVLAADGSTPLTTSGAAGTLQRAQELFTAGQYTQAESTAKAAIAATTDTAILSGAAEVVILCKLAQGDFDAAKQAAEGLKAQIADSATQSFLADRIADIEAKKAAYDKAIAELEAALKAHSADELGASAAYQIGATKLLWAKRSEALAAFQYVLDEFGYSDRALLARLAMGGIYERTGQYAEAQPLYDRIVQQSPNSSYGAQAVARIKAVRLAQGDLPGAKERMAEIIAAHPNTEASAMAQYCMGEILLAEGKVDEAKAIFAAVAHDQPNTLAGGAAAIRTVPGLMAEARALSDDARYEEAIAKYREVLDLAPNTDYAWEAKMFIGHNNLWLARPKEALPWYQEIAKAFGNKGVGPEGLYYLGWAQSQSFDYQGAIDTFTGVLQVTTEERFLVRAYWLLGCAYESLGQHDKAMAQFQGILDRPSPVFASFYPIAHDCRMRFAYDAGDYATAQAEAQALLDSVPGADLTNAAASMLALARSKAQGGK